MLGRSAARPSAPWLRAPGNSSSFSSSSLFFFLCPPSNDGTEFGGSIYQKVNDELETAVTLAWTAGSNNTRFGIAAKYKLDKDASLSVSVSPTAHLPKKKKIPVKFLARTNPSVR